MRSNIATSLTDFDQPAAASQPRDEIAPVRGAVPVVRRAAPVSVPVVVGLVGIFDCVLLFASGLASSLGSSLEAVNDRRVFGLIAVIGAILAVNLLRAMGAYRFDALGRLGATLGRVLVGWALTMATIALIVRAIDQESAAARTWLSLWTVGGWALLSVTRCVLYVLIGRWARAGRTCRMVAVIGSEQVAQRFLRQVNARPEDGRAIAGVYEVPEDTPGAMHGPRRARCMGHPILGTVDDLVRHVRQRRIDEVFVALPLSESWRLAEVMNKLSLAPVDVRLCLDEFGFQLGHCAVSHVSGVTVINALDRPLNGWGAVWKSIEDRVFAAAIVAMIAPIMLLIAAAIKLDSRGPVFFRQKRYGFNNELIEVLKFRTMYVDRTDANAEQLTRRNDPRVTRIGAFLRRTSLDELPQFINVLRGEMSVVGPRPHALSAKAGGLLYREAVGHYDSRHRIKPGITGWAQINGWRGETETIEQIRQRVEHDLYYIENWSVLLDLRIILRTVVGGFTGRAAY